MRSLCYNCMGFGVVRIPVRRYNPFNPFTPYEIVPGPTVPCGLCGGYGYVVFPDYPTPSSPPPYRQPRYPKRQQQQRRTSQNIPFRRTKPKFPSPPATSPYGPKRPRVEDQIMKNMQADDRRKEFIRETKTDWYKTLNETPIWKRNQ